MLYKTMEDVLSVNKFNSVPWNLVSKLYQGSLLKPEEAGG